EPDPCGVAPRPPLGMRRQCIHAHLETPRKIRIREPRHVQTWRVDCRDELVEQEPENRPKPGVWRNSSARHAHACIDSTQCCGAVRIPAAGLCASLFGALA